MPFAPDYEIITTQPELNDLKLRLSECPRNDDMNPLILDVETFASFDTPMMPRPNDKSEQPANDRFTAQVAGFAICWGDDKAAYIPLQHTDGNNFHFDRIVDNTEIELYRELWPFLTEWAWCNHLERFDWGIFKQRNVFVNYQFCTYIEAILTGKYFDLLKGDNEFSDAGLKALVLREFGYQMRNLEELAKFPDGYHIERVAAATAAEYACDDANWDRKLHRFLYPQVKDMFMWRVEMSVSHLTEIMEENGIPFRRKPCDIQLARLKEFVPIAREVIYSQVERQIGQRIVFDIGNPNVIRELFFESEPNDKRKLPNDWCLKLPVQKKSKKTKRASTDAKSLANLAKDFDIVHNVLVYRQIEKADTSFLATLPNYVHPKTGCIHSTFHQGGVPAGRYASSNPNAQNWSDLKEYLIKDNGGGQLALSEELQKFLMKQEGNYAEYGLQINVRDCVEVDDDEILVSADYRQVEFWAACEMAGESGMLSLIAAGHDPHTATAALMWNLPIDNVPKEFRKKGKTRNFAMLYMETDASAAFKQGTTVEEQRELRERHERAIPRVIQLRQSIIEYARRNGYIITKFGRKVDCTQLYDHPDKNVQEKGDRLAWNSMCQSFSGELPKLGMARCMTAMRNDYVNYPGSHRAVHIPLMHNGHDSLMFRLTPKVRGDVSSIDLPKFIGNIRTGMEIQVPGFQLPALIDVSIGKTYGSLFSIHDVKKPYAGMTAEEAIALIHKKEVAKTQVNGIDEAKPQVVKLQLDIPPTNEQAVALKGLLVQFPGKNVVTLKYLDGAGVQQSVVISKYPTSLTIKDGAKFGIILPCRVLAESAEDHMDFMAKAM